MKKRTYDEELVFIENNDENSIKHNTDFKEVEVRQPSSKRSGEGSPFVKALLIIAIIYIIYLILGILTTEYYTDDNGKKVAIKGDIETLENREDYDILTDYIKEVRDIMRDTTIIDIKVANGDMSYGQAAVQYNSILNDRVDVLIPRLKTVEVQTRNEHIKQDIQVILTNDIAFYLQLMYKGLQGQDMGSINDASVWKESMMQTYASINKDITELAKTLHREDTEFFKWELEKAVLDKDSAAVLRNQDDSSDSKTGESVTDNSSSSNIDSSAIF